MVVTRYVDGKLVIDVNDSAILKGKAGLAAETPTRYMDFRVTASDAAVQAIRGRLRSREAELAHLRDDNPRPRLWKKFDTQQLGAGRNVRFGDLDGDGVPEMLIAQNIPHYMGNDQYTAISCLTAVTLDGKVLWQSGRPPAHPAHRPDIPIPPGYSVWPFACQSISDWKMDFNPECLSCSAKRECCGMFGTSHRAFSKRISALSETDMAKARLCATPL